MSSTPKIMSSVTFTRQLMMQAMVRPITHIRKQFFITNIKYVSSLIIFTSNTQCNVTGNIFRLTPLMK